MSLNQTVMVADASGAIRQVRLSDLLFLRGPELRALLYSWGYNGPFRDPVYEDILARMLARIPDDIDKRQGSVIHDTLAAAAVEMTQLYLEREANRALMFASTAVGDALDKKVFEQGIIRTPATAAVRRSYFWADEEKTIPFDRVALGGVYSLELLNYTVISREEAGIYHMRCDALGAVGNQPGGEMVPVEYIQGLAVVELGEPVTPGEDAEGDEALFLRWVDWILRPPFGGNRSDYENDLRTIPGVGPVRLLRAVPEPGHVTVLLLGADGGPPDPVLIGDVQARLDPQGAEGEGIGTAPMCHIVHVRAPAARTIALTAEVTLAPGLTMGQVEIELIEAAEAYFTSLRADWGTFDREAAVYHPTIVRVAHIEAAMLDVPGIIDIAGTALNGAGENVTLELNQAPFLGEVTLHAKA